MVEQLPRTTAESAQKVSLLLVDDDPLISESLGFLLKKHYQVLSAESRNHAKKILSTLEHPPELALVDLGLPPYPHRPDEGFALIQDLLAHDPQMKILVLSGQSEESNMQHALTLGAVDFIPKPADPILLQTRLQHHLMLQQVERKQENKNDAVEIIGDSAVMQVLRQQIEQFGDSIFPVLIEGESGTGKELIAKALHQHSSRKNKPYLVINCAAIAPELLEAQLFGHIKGAFTGANKDHKGFFQEASDGTLFLDEVGELPYDLQAKLLRVLESGEFYRVGETQCIKSKARVIAATNKTLNDEVKNGQFRSDLFHRLSILKIQVPALHERERDNVLLLQYFQNLYSGSINNFNLDEEAKTLWMNYSFPGNVRELRNIVIRLGTKYSDTSINYKQLANELEMDFDSQKLSEKNDHAFSDIWIKEKINSGDFKLDKTLQELENHFIEVAMDMYEGNLSKVSKALHINRTTLYSRMHKNDEKGKS